MGRSNFFAVGVGVSSGGLKAIEAMLSHLSDNHDYTIIIAQHLSLNHQSQLVELLARKCSWEVVSARNKHKLSPGVVYIAPPDYAIEVKGFELRLKKQRKSVHPVSNINHFLTSLAESFKQKAIAVILSGTGNDDSEGVKAIHEHGGWVIVQNAAVADYESMPTSAMETKEVDRICSADQVGKEIELYIENFDFVENTSTKGVDINTEELERTNEELRRLIEELQSANEVLIHSKSGFNIAKVSREVTDLMKNKSFIHEAIRRGANLTEEAYFKDLTAQLYEIFQCNYAYIGVLSEEKKSIQTLAIRVNGNLSKNFTYKFKDVPCAAVIRLEELQHFEHVKDLFPTDPKLRKWNAESYVGVPITSPTTGKVLGIMVMIKESKFVPSVDAEYLLTILSLRAGAELERQRSFNLLRAQDIQLEKITQNSPDIIFECKQYANGSVEYTYVSRAVEDILEVSKDDALKAASLITKLIHPDDRDSFEKIQEEGWKKNEIHWIGRVISHKTREEKWLKLVAKSDGVQRNFKVWHGVIDDISVEKRQEVALREAKVEAEKAAQARETFLANMSHEIRTPLNAIYGITELLLEEEAVQDLSYLSSLKFSVENLRALINNILDFSKLSAGSVSLKPRAMDLHLLIHNLVRTHTYSADKKGIKLSLNKGEEVPTWVVADELVLYQILNNLLSNALKFTEKGEVALTVVNEKTDGDNVLIGFEISDTGLGIDPEEINRIFYKFEQGDTKYASEGSGLGLTISRLLLELWDSEMHVVSKEGMGSSFYFSVWMKQKERENQRVPAELTRADGLPPQMILLVEDVAENRLLLKRRFSKDKHFLLDEAIDGYEALEKVKKKKYDLVLMDMRMPGLNGYETMLKIRELDEYNKALPIIALTADTYGVTTDQGWADIITKPFKFKEVIDTIHKHLQHLSRG